MTAKTAKQTDPVKPQVTQEQIDLAVRASGPYDRVILLGEPGSGKTTLATGNWINGELRSRGFLRPRLIGHDLGVSDPDVDRQLRGGFDQAMTYYSREDQGGQKTSLYSQVVTISHRLKEGHPDNNTWDTLVIDTGDRLVSSLAEDLVWQHNSMLPENRQRDRIHSVEELGGGYGKGNKRIAEDLVRLTRKLDEIARFKTVVLIFQAKTKIQKDPSSSADYEKWTGSVMPEAWVIFSAWADAVLLLTRDVKLQYNKKVQSSTRVIRTNRDSRWEAKNRWGLPDSIPAEYSAFSRYLRMEKAIEKVKHLAGQAVQVDDSPFDTSISEDEINSLIGQVRGAWVRCIEVKLTTADKTETWLEPKLKGATKVQLETMLGQLNHRLEPYMNDNNETPEPG